MADRSKPDKAERTIFDTYLPFEKPIVELEKKVSELRSLTEGGLDLSGEIRHLEKKLEKVRHDVFESLTPWQRVQVARHPLRPYTLDYLNFLAEDFVELHGDRCFGDDKAVVAGLARLAGRRVCVVGHQKGRDTRENLARNFGSAHPEGYRKALRVMRLAERFGLPIVCFVDTPGAYPGIGAEERGQAQAVAVNIRDMSTLKVPVVVAVIGEGGSGGALGIGVGDHVMVLENAYYSVISPEGCAAILWKSQSKAPEAAVALKLTAPDLLEMGLIDEMVKEPLGGAHRDPKEAARMLGASIETGLAQLTKFSASELAARRYEKFRKMGVFSEN